MRAATQVYRTKHSPAHIVAHLRKGQALTANGVTASEAVMLVGASEQTYYRWQKNFGGWTNKMSVA